MREDRKPISFHQAHELLLHFEKAGITVDDLKKIIRSNDNRVAKSLSTFLHFGFLKKEARESGLFEFQDEKFIQGRRYFYLDRHFKLDNKYDVKFSQICDLSAFSNFETKYPSSVVQSYKFQSGTSDAQMIDLLGQNGEFTFGQIWQLLSIQPHGWPGGILRVNSDPNVFLVRGSDMSLNFVVVSWDREGNGWDVDSTARSEEEWEADGVIYANFPPPP